jgi:hypothetical protein
MVFVKDDKVVINYLLCEIWKESGCVMFPRKYPQPYGPIKFSYGGQPSVPTPKFSGAFNPRLSDQDP